MPLNSGSPVRISSPCWLSRRVLSALQLVKIECVWKGQPPFAKQDFNYHHKLVGPTRTDIKPLNIVQPEGPSFTVSPLLPSLPSSEVLPHSDLPYCSGPSLMLHACGIDARMSHCVCLAIRAHALYGHIDDLSTEVILAYLLKVCAHNHSRLRQAWLAQVEGNLIKWQRWHIRIGFTWREGLVIYNVAYEDEGRLRPILNRASIAEMAVPYGEPQVGLLHDWASVPSSTCNYTTSSLRGPAMS